jgi:hypothetical protein
MSKEKRPSFELRKIIWDIAATVGKDKPTEIQRQLDIELEKRRQAGKFFENAPKSLQTITSIVKGINELDPEIVVTKLRSHVWKLRDDYEIIKQLAEEKKQISGQNIQNQDQGTTSQNLQPQPHGISDRQSEILSRLNKYLNDIEGIAQIMTGSAVFNHPKEDYRELFQRTLKLAQEELVNGRLFLPIDLVKTVEAFFQKITEMNLEFETAIDVHTPDGPERAKYWDKARTIAFQEIPRILDRIEGQARTIIADKVKPTVLGPSIEVTPRRDSDDYYLEVKNNGNLAEFEAQIEIMKDATGYHKGKLYLGWWEFGQGSRSTFGNVDKIKIARLETTIPPRGVQAIADFFMKLQLYYMYKSGVEKPYLWDSTSWTTSENNAIPKPGYILKVIITSNPPLREGKFIREYKLDFEGFSEIAII